MSDREEHDPVIDDAAGIPSPALAVEAFDWVHSPRLASPVGSHVWHVQLREDTGVVEALGRMGMACQGQLQNQ